ncbi:hypothetical protein TWF694_006148 [Orbilia ellipsospora]|uniref:Nucleoside phosphorylase domain-containing protein n=1 Tax=Orbilia ellipsospora TaxID=2528407 RepID=A0AAV9WRF4_9PEZI
MSNWEYTVGWICALHIEYVAAQAFLDEDHGEPREVSKNNINTYKLGTIGCHKVVIAVLPDGEYGTSMAASVARDMLHNFPNIRIGLMVGIGGGAPSRKHDIRLGDIVVSSSRNENGGVFQYDFGKTVQELKFQATGHLNKPPTLLHTTVSGIKAEYEMKGHQLDETVAGILKKWPRLRKKYKRPDPKSDRLYHSHIVHPPNDEGSCSEICGDGLSKLVSRDDRDEEEESIPVVHYGLIASANQVMKDASIRDILIKEKDVLCFEMEAAGLMNHFPCLVIRGICDYSDSHKNKEWQGYAAMTAAAYAKDLLLRIPRNKVEAERKIVELMSGVLDTLSRTETVAQTIRSSQEEEENTEILNWLTEVNYGPQQTDYINRRQAGTGQWLLDSAEFLEWARGHTQTLFCPGIPGAGKTIITSIVVDYLSRHLQGPNIGIAYIYFNIQQKNIQKADNLVASLLKQLAESQSPLSENIKDIYSRRKSKHTRPSFEELSEALQLVTRTYTRVFIIIDALDECQTAGGCRKQFLDEIFRLQTEPTVSIFATSRIITEICDMFQDATSLTILARGEDIEKYIDGRISGEDLELLKGMSSEIKEGITRVARGMFLLAKLHFDSVCTGMTLREIKSTLEHLPVGPRAYDEAYDQAMSRIVDLGPRSEKLARLVISWIICAKRPLTTSELQHALAIKPEDKILDFDNFIQIKVMISACAGLVTVDKESNIIRLVHATTQEYFERKQEQHFPRAEMVLARTCMIYLLFDEFEDGACPSDGLFEVRLQKHPFYDYVARNWGHHARAGFVEEVEELVLEFLRDEAKIAACNQAAMASGGPLNYSQTFPRRVTGLHLASYFGLGEVVATLLSEGYTADIKDTYGQTPLLLASMNGHDVVVSLLLACGAVNRNSEDRYGRTPLSYAVAYGHERVARKLLSKDEINQESKDIYGQTPLAWAEAGGHTTVIDLLLAKEKKTISTTNTLQNPSLLFKAVKSGDEVAVKMFAKFSPPNSRDGCGRTPLSWAVTGGNQAITEFLLNSGKFEADLSDNHGRTPLSWAAMGGHEAIIKLLLSLEVNINSKDDHGRSPLMWATMGGRHNIVKMFLEADNIDTKIIDDCGRTLLSLAAGGGHGAILKLLLNTDDSNVNCGAADGVTPLILAILNADHASVESLLEHGASCESKDTNGRTPIWHAAGGGHGTILGLLLNVNDSSVNCGDKDGITPLMQAIRKADDASVNSLLEHGASCESKDTNGRTPIWYAASKGRKTVVEILMKRSETEAREQDIDGITPVLCAAERGHLDVVKMFLEKGIVATLDRPMDSDGSRYALGVIHLLTKKHQLEFPLHSGITKSSIAYHSSDPQRIRYDVIILGLLSNADKMILETAVENGHDSVLRLMLEILFSELQQFLFQKIADIKSSDGGSPYVLRLTEDGGDNIVRRLLEGTYGAKLLCSASRNGHKEIARLLIEGGADIEAEDEVGRTPLQVAAENGHEVVARLLIDYGAHFDSSYDHDLLQNLARGGYTDSAGCLLRFIQENNGDVMQPLWLAALNGHQDVAKLLLEKGANTELKRGSKSLLRAVVEKGLEDMARLLLEEGAQVITKGRNREPLLQTAIENKHWTTAQLLLEKGAEIREFDVRALFESAEGSWDDEVVQTLLERWFRVRLMDDISLISWLYQACKGGHEHLVRMLLENNKGIGSKDNKTKGRGSGDYNDDHKGILDSLLYLAAMNGHKTVVQLLLDEGFDIETETPNGKSPLWIAVQNGHGSVVRILIERGASFKKMHENMSLLQSAIEHKHWSIAQLLVDNGAMYRQNIILELLAGVVENGNMVGVEQLLDSIGTAFYRQILKKNTDFQSGENNDAGQSGDENGVDSLFTLLADEDDLTCEGKDNPLDTAFLEAARDGPNAIIRLLLERYHDRGREWLLEASRKGYTAVVQLLLEKGFDSESKDYRDESLLSIAAERGHEALVRLLVGKGASAGIIGDHFDGSSTWAAARNGHWDIAQFLLENGAEIDDIGGLTKLALQSQHKGIRETCVSKFGKSLLLQATEREMVSLLLSGGVPVESRDHSGRSPLWIACENGRYDVVRLLLDQGADIESTNNDGKSPFWVATHYLHLDICQMLLEAAIKSSSLAVFQQMFELFNTTICQVIITRTLEENNGSELCVWVEAAKKAYDDVISPFLREKCNTALLIKASTNGQDDFLRFLIEKGANINSKKLSSPRFQLECAIENNDSELCMWAEAAKKAYDDVISPLFREKSNTALLIKASTNGQDDFLRFLIEKGAKVNSEKLSSPRSPLGCAIKNNLWDTILLLLENGASTDGYVALLENAAGNGDATVFQRLLDILGRRFRQEMLDKILRFESDSGTDIDGDVDMLIWGNAAREGHPAIIRLILAGECGARALLAASRTGNEITVRLLLNNNINPHRTYSSEPLPLCAAAENGCWAIVQLLLEDSTAADYKTKDINSLLEYAAANATEAIVKTLLEKGASINEGYENGQSPLWIAAQQGNKHVVRNLLYRGADIESTNLRNESPLWVAAERGNDDVVQILLEKGASIDLKDQNGKSPLWVAAEYGHKNTVRILLESGARIDSRDQNHLTPLCVAAQKGHTSIMKLLLDHGAAVELGHCGHGSPLWAAIRANNRASVQLLFEMGDKFGPDKDVVLLLEEITRLGDHGNMVWTLYRQFLLEGKHSVDE